MNMVEMKDWEGIMIINGSDGIYDGLQLSSRN
jgi:hypothetical protein